MKYCSIDIETTGTDSETHNILEFAAVVDDLKDQKPIGELPRFQTYIYRQHYLGSAFALSMHGEAFRKIADWKTSGIEICVSDDLLTRFYTFLTTHAGYTSENGKVTLNCAGKNFGNFDLKFIEKLPYFGEQIRFRHRYIEPAMFYLDPFDDEVPDTEKCMERAGVKGDVAHTALEDALVVVGLIRKHFKEKVNDTRN